MEKANFMNFVNDDDFYTVVRILNYPDSIVKDLKKTQEFKAKDEAIKYFHKIKNDFVENTEVLTAIFKGIHIDDEFWKIKPCKKAKVLTLDL
jgi:hypothetical protein